MIFTDNNMKGHDWIDTQLVMRMRARVFADFIVYTEDRYSRPALLARQIIPVDFAVTNYLGRKAVYSNKYTMSVDICIHVIHPHFYITIANSNGQSRSFRIAAETQRLLFLY